jgi:protein FRG1
MCMSAFCTFPVVSADLYRSVDEVAAGGKVEIRGDAESVGFNETFTLRMQARLRKKAKTVSVARQEPKLSRRELETMYVP